MQDDMQKGSFQGWCKESRSSLPRKSVVRITGRPDMTSAVYYRC